MIKAYQIYAAWFKNKHVNKISLPSVFVIRAFHVAIDSS